MQSTLFAAILIMLIKLFEGSISRKHRDSSDSFLELIELIDLVKANAKALPHSCLSPAAKVSERRKWKTDRHILCLSKERYSLLMICNTQIPGIQDWRFSVCPAKSKAEYMGTGNQLNNCLKNWEETKTCICYSRQADLGCNLSR